MDNKAFFKMSYGLYIVSSAFEGKDAGCVINTATQVTSEPKRMMVAVNKENYTTEIIEKSGLFTVVAFTEEADMELIGKFGFNSSKDTDKFSQFKYETDENGVKYISEKTAAIFSCRVVNKLDVGTHYLFIGDVTNAEVLSSDEPMTYTYYHKVKKGLTPPKASSYMAEQMPTEETSKKTIWKCSICGYEYEGEELPEGYVCPICGQPASVFVKL